MKKTIPHCPTNWFKETKQLNTFSVVFYHICLILQLKCANWQTFRDLVNTGAQIIVIPGDPLGFPGGSDGKASAYNVGNPGSIHGSGRSPGEGNGNPLQFSCWGNSVDRGAWWATVHGIARVGHNLATKPPPTNHNK